MELPTCGAGVVSYLGGIILKLRTKRARLQQTNQWSYQPVVQAVYHTWGDIILKMRAKQARVQQTNQLSYQPVVQAVYHTLGI